MRANKTGTDMRKFTINLSDADYAAFKTSRATRLYQHERSAGGDVAIWSSNPRQLCRDLEAVIDFGATSAAEVLGVQISPEAQRKTVDQIIAGMRRI